MYNPQAVARPLDTTQEDLHRRISEDLQQQIPGVVPFRISPLYSGYENFLAAAGYDHQPTGQPEQSEQDSAAEQPESEGNQGEGATGGAEVRYSDTDPAAALPRK